MIGVFIKTETGVKLDELIDEQDQLPDILRLAQGEAFPKLRYVDPYGDTVFNRAQQEQLLAELGRLHGKVKKVSQLAEFVRAIEVLVRKAASEPHQYIVFEGD